MDDSAPGTRVVTLITRRDCSLCTVALEHLERLAPAMGFEVRVVDVRSSLELLERYRHAVPVVRANGLTLLSGRIDPQELRRELDRAFGSDPRAGVPAEEEQFLPVLHCPVCEGTLESRPRAVACLKCGHEYERRGGVLMLQAVPERESRFGFMDIVGRLIQFKLEPPEEKK